jgi:3-hydroxyisobutyrate dehydrogenase-like beta-hydroxyacid dehydrogenase
MTDQKIAYLGLGVMGAGMTANLIRAGYEVTVWNRSPGPSKLLVDQGAKLAATPAEAADGADVVLYCLANDAAVEDVVFGDDGVLQGAHEGLVAVDMSTVRPATSERQAAAFRARGADFLDAPVFGSRGEAANAGLWIVVGGEREVYERVRPVLDVLSESTHYMGGTGKGASMKLVGNMIVTFQLQALGEAMVMAGKAGLSARDVLDVLHVVDFRSPLFDGVGASLLERDFSVSFALKHLYKDANLIAGFAEELRSPAPAAAVIRETIKTALNHGWGEENASAMIKALELQGNTEIR